jgi:hypothetical protein
MDASGFSVESAKRMARASWGGVRTGCRVEQVNDRFGILYGGRVCQFEDDALHRLIPKWCYNKTTRLDVQGEFRGNGIIEDAGDGGDVYCEAGEHELIITFSG